MIQPNFNSLKEWHKYQNSQTFNKIDLSLERCQIAIQRLQLKQPNYLLISVAGTNGKGSSVALLAAIYQAAGYRVGQCTSPHLLNYRERFQINNKWIDESQLCQQFQMIKNNCDDLKLSRFEYDTLAAYLWFSNQQLDVVIMEVGLGGRLDAVNVLDADATIITNISLDHCDYLGDNREDIAYEKAGILRPQQIAAYAETNPPQRLQTYAQQLDCDIEYLDQDFNLNILKKFALNSYWQSQHQQQNAAAVINIVQRLQNRLPLNKTAIAQGLQIAQMSGRLQWLSPNCLIDVAHNPAAAQVLAQTLKQQPCSGKTHALVAMLKDKDITTSLKNIAPEIDIWHTAALNVERAASLTEMQTQLQFSSAVHSYSDIKTAYQQLQQQIKAPDRLVVFGSFHTVAAVLTSLC